MERWWVPGCVRGSIPNFVPELTGDDFGDHQVCSRAPEVITNGAKHSPLFLVPEEPEGPKARFQQTA